MRKINIEKIPKQPGAYSFYDSNGEILYIGKAKNLKNRISSYFHRSASLAPDKQKMVNRIKKVEYIITSTETEALLLEASLIKKHQPPFNIDLKDDKNFLFIKITVNEEFPRVFTVRKIINDRAKYFGPYASAFSVKNTLHTLRRLFPHRNFPKQPNKNQLRNIINRYPQLMGPKDLNEYRYTIDRIIHFLKGNYQDIVKSLRMSMIKLSAQKHFEQAGELRDKIEAIEKMMEKQKVISTKKENQDIISLARENDKAAINLFSIRQGKLIAKQDFILTNTAGQSEKVILQTFIERFYAEHTNLPTTIILPVRPTNPNLLIRTFNWRIIVPSKGLKKQYLNLGLQNAENYLEQQKASWEKDSKKNKQALLEFQKLLKLKTLPNRIETYDISNIQGKDAVGSMIVFTNAQPDKKWYRKFEIKTVSGSNDPAMMAEIIGRRFKHLNNEEKAIWPKPDLIILDGGKGQLNTVLKSVKIKLPIIALAKKHEDIYLPGKKNPINFKPDSDAMYLIQRMRDEAHRFAISYFRSTHTRNIKKSLLDDIPGLGPKNKKKLMNHFGIIKYIRQASETELEKIVGNKLAKTIKDNI